MSERIGKIIFFFAEILCYTYGLSLVFDALWPNSISFLISPEIFLWSGLGLLFFCFFTGVRKNYSAPKSTYRFFLVALLLVGAIILRRELTRYDGLWWLLMFAVVVVVLLGTRRGTRI